MTGKRKYHVYALGVLAIFAYLVLTEIADRWSTAWTEYSHLETKKNSMRDPESVVSYKRELQAEITQIRASYNALSGQLDQSETGVIDWVDQSAKLARVRVESLTPHKSQDSSTIAFTLDVVGEFHRIGQFVNHLEGGPIAMKVVKIDLSRDTRASLRAKLEIHATLVPRKESR